MGKYKTIFQSLLFLTMLNTCCIGYAQPTTYQIDHYSMIVEDLKTTGSFYSDVLQLKEIPHPGGAEGFRWFSIDGRSQLHLIKKDKVSRDKNKSVHLCLSVPNLTAMIDYLNKNNTPFWDWAGAKNKVTQRADGVQQIYLQDPENNWIEINDAGN